MEEAKMKLISMVDRYRKIELFSIILKLIPVILYIVIAPVAIWFQVVENQLFIAIVLSLAEVLLLFKFRSYFSFFLQHMDLKNCKLYKSVIQPDIVTEIFVYPDRISIDLQGAENYTVSIRGGELKEEFVEYFRMYFGDERIFYRN